MSEPLAYHITWRTYGTWLPGDDRNWVKHKSDQIHPGNDPLHQHASSLLQHDAVMLSDEQRAIVDAAIREHCKFRGWELHALNVRTNHVHLVVSAAIHPDQVMQQFKAWASRRLNAATKEPPAKWRAIHGSTKWINEPRYLEEAITYYPGTNDAQ